MRIPLKHAIMTMCIMFTGCSQQPGPTENQKNTTNLRIAADDDPQSLDPRQARDLKSSNYMHMLFEGLMRADFSGKLVPALAETINVSDDLKTYTFKIRKSCWSNGDPVTAEDFEYSWKSILSPKFAASNAYQFYIIKGAKAAKEGKGSLDDVGIKAIDAETLKVTLDSPTPYFLELLAFHPFFPVNSQWAERHPNWSSGDPKLFVSNGPYLLNSWKRHNELIVVKNPNYHDADNVVLEQITAQIVSPSTSYKMYESGTLDWVGSPMGTIPTDAIVTLKEQGLLEVAPAAGTSWVRLNIEKHPLNNVKFRQALAFAIDRQSLVKHVLKANQTPATAIVPPSMGLHLPGVIVDHNVEKARALFNEALQELGTNVQQLSEITLCYANDERTHQVVQALQQQWKEVLGIDIKLDACENQVYYDRLKRRDYQMANGSWFADFRDPINFLDVFKYKNNGTNNTQWENPRYIELLGQSTLEPDPAKRKELMSQAEELILTEMPVIPLYHASFGFVKREDLMGVYFSDLGYLDFKEAYFDEDETEF